MKARLGLRQLQLAATVGLSVCLYGCGDSAEPTTDDANRQVAGAGVAPLPGAPVTSTPPLAGAHAAAGSVAPAAGSVAPPTSADAGPTSVDAGNPPMGADGTKDASVGNLDAGSTPDASQDGGIPGSGLDAGATGTADASTPEPGSDPCSVMAYQVNGGVPVRGVGCKGQWEGIVMTVGGRGLCTAAFISERHLISASHCYARDGAVSVKVSAPTWEDGAEHTFQAQVKRSGSSQTVDVSVIDLGKAVDWATPERRFVLHAGKASAVDMHLYGFGSGGSSGGAGMLRGVPNRATIHVTDNGRGTLSGVAGAAQLCTGDSGGPAFVEKTAAVLYGINQAIVPGRQGGGRTCASSDWTIMFTNVSMYVPFVEETIGKPCTRKRVDDLDVAQCW